MISYFRPESLFGKFVAAALVVSHLAMMGPAPVIAQIAEIQKPQLEPLPDSFKEDWVPPTPILTPREITLNKAAPVTAPNLEIPKNRTLTSKEIKGSRVLDTPLFETGSSKQSAKQQEEAIGQLLVDQVETNSLSNPQNAQRLKSFVQQHPESGYNTSLLIEAAEIEWRNGFFTNALKTLQQAWDGAKFFNEIDDRRLAEIALGRLLERRSSLGQKEELHTLIEESGKRSLGGYAADALIRAKEVYWFLNNKAERNVFCGFSAANAVCVPFGEKPIFPDVHDDEERAVFIKDGLSAFELKAHSHEAGGTLRVVMRKPGAPIVVPSVVHFNFNHFSAITEQKDGLFRVTDEHLRFDSWVSAEALEEQMTGYFLIPEAVKTPVGYLQVSDTESKNFFGRHCVHQRDPEDCQTKGGGNNGTCPVGMATYSFSLMNPGLFIQDNPVRHVPPYGPSVNFEVSYDQRSTVIADLQTLGNLGPRWAHAYAEAIVLTGSGIPNTQVRWVQGVGSYFQYSYNSSTSSYNQKYKERPRLTYLSTGLGGPGYQLTYPDGSRKLFKQPNATTPTKYLLTQIIDPLGNALTLQYDSQLRLTTILDALNQATTLGYSPEVGDNVSTDTFKIRQVTDPFSRVAKFKYTTTGQLHKVIDPVGIVSEFRYTSGDFIDKLTTPYGPMEFSQGDLPGINSEPGRWIESKDAQGARERVEANDLALPESYVAEPAAPTTVAVNGTEVPFLPKNDNLFYRNTFYWDRQQMHWWPNDYKNCRIYNWLTTTSDTITSVLGSVKDPLEGRIWFNYPDQTSSHAVGTVRAPSKVVRAVEGSDGAPVWGMSQGSFNDLGLSTGTVDMEGRELKYEYYPNNQDLQYVKVKDGLSLVTLSTISQYKTISGQSVHLPEIITDASGLQTQISYNDKGQITQKTVSKGGNNETTRYIYDLNLDGTADAYGYLIRVEHTSPANPSLYVTLQSLSYDVAKRVRTVTNVQGYTLTYDYDNLNRVTVVTHPDSTTEQVTYIDGVRQTMDVWAAKDRADRWTRMRYSQHRQLVMHLDPLLRLTKFAWCLCGQMRQLIDPTGRITSWKRDAQGRVIEKELPDNEKYLYTFQSLSGRLATESYPKDVKNNKLTISYDYHLSGEMKTTDYTDVAMPDVSYAKTDFLGRLTSVTDGMGDTFFTYVTLSGAIDGAGKMISVNGPSVNDTIRYAYDWQGRIEKTELVDDDGVSVTRSEEITLDSLGRPIQIENNLGVFTKTFNNGNLTTMPDIVSLPGGFSSEYLRYSSAAGANALRLKTLHHKIGGSTVQKHDYIYDISGNISHWSQTNKDADITSWALQHDPANQLSELEETSNSILQKKENWHYDASGNIASTITTPAGVTGTLRIREITGRNQFASIGGAGKTVVEGVLNEAAKVKVNTADAQVTKLGGSGAWKFSKEIDFPSGVTNINVQATDGNNNVTTKNYSVNVSSSTDLTYEYDDNGNLSIVRDNTSAIVRLYEWDSLNRLLSVQSPAALTVGTKRSEFTYDGANRRIGHIEKEYDGSSWLLKSTCAYIWNGLEIVQKRDVPSGDVLVNYFSEGEEQQGDALVYMTDHLGTPRNWYRVSDGFQGSATFNASGRRDVIAVGPGLVERGYTGHLHHQTSGLVLAPFRAYDPEIGRWISEDPIQEAGGVNLYSYVGNQPILYKDRYGLELGAAAVGAIIGGIGGAIIGGVNADPCQGWILGAIRGGLGGVVGGAVGGLTFNPELGLIAGSAVSGLLGGVAGKLAEEGIDAIDGNECTSFDWGSVGMGAVGGLIGGAALGGVFKLTGSLSGYGPEVMTGVLDDVGAGVLGWSGGQLSDAAMWWLD